LSAIVDISDLRRAGFLVFDLFLKRFHSVFGSRCGCVVTNLVEVDSLQQCLVLVLPQRIFPVLDLRVAGKQQTFLADLEDENDAGVIHLLIQHPHDLQQLLPAHGARMIAQPAGADGILAPRASTWRGNKAASSPLIASSVPTTWPETARTHLIAAALLLDLVASGRRSAVRGRAPGLRAALASNPDLLPQ
jgi:hypothetical protein